MAWFGAEESASPSAALAHSVALSIGTLGKQTLDERLTTVIPRNTQRGPAMTTMESYNLKTASTYINNLLLARGLLRNGKPIEFAHPSRGEGGKEVTMAQIINLVHDLILKRDVCIMSRVRCDI